MDDIKPLHTWSLWPNLERPLAIAGPCSVETREQTLETCLGIAQHKVHLLRGGIWKPRTRPNAFEGIGAVGLPWLKEAGLATGLPVSIEVAKAEHVEQALAAGIDVLWIGARTTVNPFAVQEIAEVLRGVDVPVFIKNPVNLDLELWIGAFERLYQVGLRELAAIHRGFSQYGQTQFRNPPHWEIPIEFRRRHPHVGMIVDPSHICGRRDILLETAQFGLDLGYDGYMIESHCTPDTAWSDAKQQVTPEVLGQIMAKLELKQSDTSDPIFASKLQALRQNIDQLDDQLVKLLAERMRVARLIGDYKRENGVSILQLQRWQSLSEQRTREMVAAGLSEEFARWILQAIHNESIQQQSK
jgi:chorismate mutase